MSATNSESGPTSSAAAELYFHTKQQLDPNLFKTIAPPPPPPPTNLSNIENPKNLSLRGTKYSSLSSKSNATIMSIMSLSSDKVPAAPAPPRPDTLKRPTSLQSDIDPDHLLREYKILERKFEEALQRAERAEREKEKIEIELYNLKRKFGIA
jgi:hypothetical protein